MSTLLQQPAQAYLFCLKAGDDDHEDNVDDLEAALEELEEASEQLQVPLLIHPCCQWPTA